MTKVKVYKSLNKDSKKAFNEVANKIDSTSKLILFFASTIYSYDELVSLFCDKFPNSQVVGLTTVGEINNLGIHENSLTVASFAGPGFNTKAVFMEDIQKYPVFQRDELITAANATGINMNSKNLEKEGFALVFPNGLINAEERMLSIVNSIFPNEGFPIFGGTAGDDSKFVKTYNSLNRKISDTSGIVIFVKLQEDFKIYKESIFEPFSDKTLVATKVDVEGRKVYEFNGRKASEEYARILGVTERDLESKFMAHPLGFVAKQLSVGSPMCVNSDGSISFYCQVSRNAEMKILNPLDVLQTMDKTVQMMNSDFKSIEATLTINCILRKIQFQQTNLIQQVNQRFEKMPNAFGFCSYGEQLSNEQINQTLILLTIGKLNGAIK